MVPAVAANPREEYHELSSLYVPIALAVFVVVAVALAVPLVRDRASRKDEPDTRTTSTRLEAGFAVGLALVAAFLAWRTLDAVGAVRPVSSQDASTPAGNGLGARGGDEGAGVVIRAIGAKWNWRFEYPGGVAVQGVADRPATMVVPSDVRVRVRLTSRDVIHALWIPKARAKYDAIPGYVNAFDLRFERGRRYDEDRCSEYCGLYHTDMVFDVRVLAPGAFRAWLRGEQQRAAQAAS